ncbi:transposase IS4 family protein [Parageobacillus genomosp. 1]|uniref:Transposase IS4 family protein n=1 Tax=Parageobacillus genomosp. 1 TaxID=1295642 RepID=A0ABC9VGC3_9BACL|nr:hypothetical protein [Parageobacillus genomosp. 1]EZP77554.1 transposase IS4 family protein [Parageobacillus genomosp. 1]
MISNLNSEHAWSYEIDPLLASLFRYIDSLSLPETPYVTGRPPVSKKSLLKCFFLKIFISPINRRNSEERKDAYGRVLPVFLKTRFGQWPFGLRRGIERVFNELKSDGVEQPRWYGFHRYVLHVLCCILMHNFEFLL